MVRILDTNDNSPAIESGGGQTVTLSEATEVGTSVGAPVTVEDNDDGENGQVYT